MVAVLVHVCLLLHLKHKTHLGLDRTHAHVLIQPHVAHLVRHLVHLVVYGGARVSGSSRSVSGR